MFIVFKVGYLIQGASILIKLIPRIMVAVRTTIVGSSTIQNLLNHSKMCNYKAFNKNILKTKTTSINNENSNEYEVSSTSIITIRNPVKTYRKVRAQIVCGKSMYIAVVIC